jgi:hypothetical protein
VRRGSITWFSLATAIRFAAGCIDDLSAAGDAKTERSTHTSDSLATVE